MESYQDYIPYPSEQGVSYFSVFESLSFHDIVENIHPVNIYEPISFDRTSYLATLFEYISSRPYQIYYDGSDNPYMVGFNLYDAADEDLCDTIIKLIPKRYTILSYSDQIWGPRGISIYFSDISQAVDVYNELLRLYNQ